MPSPSTLDSVVEYFYSLNGGCPWQQPGGAANLSVTIAPTNKNASTNSQTLCRACQYSYSNGSSGAVQQSLYCLFSCNNSTGTPNAALARTQLPAA